LKRANGGCKTEKVGSMGESQNTHISRRKYLNVRLGYGACQFSLIRSLPVLIWGETLKLRETERIKSKPRSREEKKLGYVKMKTEPLLTAIRWM